VSALEIFDGAVEPKEANKHERRSVAEKTRTKRNAQVGRSLAGQRSALARAVIGTKKERKLEKIASDCNQSLTLRHNTRRCIFSGLF